MDELYDDLENYDDIDAVSQLKTENSELKHKLGECNKSMEMLQKDFDKLAAEFKVLQTNYSSLLMIARAEVQRKTEMISSLNVEKDMLIITAAQKAPPNQIRKLVKNVQTEAKRKKKKNRKTAGLGPKDRTEFIRRECERRPSPEASSTATDISNKMEDNDRVTDNTKTIIRVPQENEAHKREVFPDHRGDGNRSPAAVDRRLSALARHQFSKLSSDEEFEDLYSALKPITSLREPERPYREPERNRKRGREDTEESKTFYNNTYDRSSNYPDPFRERCNRNKTGRFSNNDRNMKRDKQHNESDRHMNRDKQYDNKKSDKYDLHYQRYSPERHRRGVKEHPDDRYTQQYERSRRLLSPPRERNQHRSRERRRSCHDREREDHKDAHRHNYPDTHSARHHILGEYDEPQTKRPRIDPPYPIHQEERRLSEKQYSKELYPSSLKDHTCQSPDFTHEESSNEPIPEIRSTASTVLEDPRVTSKKYVKSIDSNKEVLQAANANKIYLQPVNKSLWNLQEVQVPKALKFRPSEISEELVDEVEVDKPLSIISMESGELGLETTDTVIDEASDFLEVNRSNYKYWSCNIDNNKIENSRKENTPIENTPENIGYKGDILKKHNKERSTENTSKDNENKSDVSEKHHKEKSPIDNTSKTMEHKSHALDKEPKTITKLVKSAKVHDHRIYEPPRDNYKVATETHSDTIEKPNILQKLINSVLDKSPERENSDKLSKSKERKEHKEISESSTLDKIKQETSKTVEQKEHTKSSEPQKENESSVQVFREFEHRVYSTRHIVEGDLELSDESNDETQLKIDEKRIEVKVKQKIRSKSARDIGKEKPVNLEDKPKKTRLKKGKDKEEKTTTKFSELFGDSSSLITPEDLNLPPRVPTECCPPAPEDTQDGIIESQESRTLMSKDLNSNSKTKGNSDGSTIEEEKHQSKLFKESKSRSHKRNKNSESALVLDDRNKAPDRQELNEVKKNTVTSTESSSVTGLKLVLSNEKLKERQTAKIITDTNKNDSLKLNEKPKGSVKTNKKLKNKDEKRLSISEPVEESNTKSTYNVLETNTNKPLASDNKENASGNDNSDGNISSEMARIFENTLVSDVSKEKNEKLRLTNSQNDTINSTVVQNVPNLAPVLDEPGLVKTVVISTGIQLLDSSSTQYATTFNALASSTPAKELTIVNTSSEVEPKISHSAHVSVTIERDDTVSQSENDAPDIRINYYRRRRKVLKR